MNKFEKDMLIVFSKLFNDGNFSTYMHSNFDVPVEAYKEYIEAKLLYLQYVNSMPFANVDFEAMIADEELKNGSEL